MQEVFGEGEVNQLFGYHGHSGTKTVQAKQLLKDAKEHLSTLEANENSYSKTESLESKKQKILLSARKRLAILEAVDFVFNQEEYRKFIKDENVRTLDFRNENDPLWRRIRRAELFCDRVLAIRNEIFTQIDTLEGEMRTQAKSLTHFPTQLFILSLEKIRHILEGAIKVSTPLGSTAELQMTDASALGQCLKDLRIAEAMNRLARLSREVGLDIENAVPAKIPFEEIDGDIIGEFRRFKKGYEILQEQLEDAKVRLNKLDQVLADAPSTFKYPEGVDSFQQLKLRPGFIEGSLADIREDEVEILREDPNYDRPAKQGNFQPLMKAADNLLNAPKQQLTQLRGQILTLENEVGGFITNLLNQTEIQKIEHSLNQLLQAKGQPLRASLTRIHLENTGSLKAALSEVENRKTSWIKEGTTLLGGVVSFDRWQRIVELVEDGRDPDLSPEEEQHLVRERLLVRTYRLGG